MYHSSFKKSNYKPNKACNIDNNDIIYDQLHHHNS